MCKEKPFILMVMVEIYEMGHYHGQLVVNSGLWMVMVDIWKICVIRCLNECMLVYIQVLV